MRVVTEEEGESVAPPVRKGTLVRAVRLAAMATPRDPEGWLRYAAAARKAGDHRTACLADVWAGQAARFDPLHSCLAADGALPAGWKVQIRLGGELAGVTDRTGRTAWSLAADLHAFVRSAVGCAPEDAVVSALQVPGAQWPLPSDDQLAECWYALVGRAWETGPGGRDGSRRLVVLNHLAAPDWIEKWEDSYAFGSCAPE